MLRKLNITYPCNSELHMTKFFLQVFESGVRFFYIIYIYTYLEKLYYYTSRPQFCYARINSTCYKNHDKYRAVKVKAGEKKCLKKGKRMAMGGYWLRWVIRCARFKHGAMHQPSLARYALCVQVVLRGLVNDAYLRVSHVGSMRETIRRQVRRLPLQPSSFFFSRHLADKSLFAWSCDNSRRDQR